jgi:hypothetical protein
MTSKAPLEEAKAAAGERAVEFCAAEEPKLHAQEIREFFAKD